MGDRQAVSIGDRMLRGSAGLAIVLVAYVAIAAWGFASDRYLNDEGLLSHLFASGCARDFEATFFLQKSRPPICALYAPVAALGLRAFLFTHIAVGGFAVVALARAATGLGHRHANLVAAGLALSPLMLGGAVAGVSNTDAVAAVCGFLWLRSSGRNVSAAVVLGAAVFIRSELAVLAAVVVLDAGLRRRPLELVGLAAFAVAYGLAGVIYHRDLLWMFHFPPALAHAMPDSPFWATHAGGARLEDVVTTGVALTPLLPAIALVRWGSLAPLERTGLYFAGLFACALLLLPQWRIFNFDQSPRYLLPLLPCVLLALGRVFDGLGLAGATQARSRLPLPLLAALAGLAFAGALGAPHPTGLLAVGIVAAALALGRAQLATWGVAVFTALVVVGPFAFGDGARIDRRSMAPHLDEMVDRLDEAQAGGVRPVFTNEPLLSVYLYRTGRPYAAAVHYIVQADQRFELDSLANPNNGQREALWRALAPDFYGIPVRANPLRPDAVPANALFALTKDARLDMTMPPSLWDGKLRVISPGYGTVVAEFEEDDAP